MMCKCGHSRAQHGNPFTRQSSKEHAACLSERCNCVAFERYVGVRAQLDDAFSVLNRDTPRGRAATLLSDQLGQYPEARDVLREHSALVYLLDRICSRAVMRNGQCNVPDELIAEGRTLLDRIAK